MKKLFKWEEIGKTGNLLDYEYTNKQTELENPDLKQQINFNGRSDEDNGTKIFFIIEKSEETTFESS